MTDKPTLLVTGASGQLGQRVLELLLEADAGTIIATTRTPDKLAHFAQQGVIVRQADFDDPDSLKQAFDGADRMLLISTDAVGEPGKRLQQHTTAVTVAEAVGINHVIYTSLLEPVGSPVKFAPDHEGTEKALADSGMGWTILRNNLYMDLLISSINQAYQLGGIFKATGDGKVSYITREDCAQVAAVALASDFDGQRILDITGSVALSQDDVATLASDITGKPLAYTPVELDAVIQGMVGAGLPQPVAEVFASIDVAIAQGNHDTVSSAFEDLTGKQPMTPKDFLTANQEALP